MTQQLPISMRLVAGEPSGDLLASKLIAGIRQNMSQADFAGIAGPHMQAAGCAAWWPSEKLAVRGYVEVLRHYRTIKSIRDQLVARLLQEKPALFIGIDAPDFNLGLETKLKAKGIKTAHFISPSIWAWRGGRIKKIAQAVDHMLCVFPFEPALYAQAGIAATYVGYPLADQIPIVIDTVAARQQLGLSTTAPLLAVLPGSRHSEIQYIAPRFIATMRALHQQRPQLEFLVPLATAQTAQQFRQLLQNADAQDLPLHLLDGQSHTALAAADAVLVASGTATLECALFKKPMVIAYHMAWLSFQIMRHMNYLPWIGLPNILLQRTVVPEFIQAQATAVNLAQACLQQLDDQANRQRLELCFTELHWQLRQNMPQRAAQVIEGLLQ